MRKSVIVSHDWDKLEGLGENKRFTTTRCTECDGEFETVVEHYKNFRNIYGEWSEWRVVEIGYHASKDELFDYVNFVVKEVKKYVEEKKGVYQKIKEIRETDNGIIEI